MANASPEPATGDDAAATDARTRLAQAVAAHVPDVINAMRAPLPAAPELLPPDPDEEHQTDGPQRVDPVSESRKR